MEFKPEERDEYEFVKSLVQAVPALHPIWESFDAECGVFIPTTLMTHLAQGMVVLAQDVHESGNQSSAAALARAYACIEKGLAEPSPSPIPALIRDTWGGWLGQQAVESGLYTVLCESMGTAMRKALRPLHKLDKGQLSPPGSSGIPWAEPSSESFELELLHREVWSFALLRIPDTNRLFLHVLCGTVGIYDVTIELNPEELADLRQQGIRVVEEWARSITQRPTSVRSRQVKIPKVWKWSAINPGLWQAMEQTETDYKDWAQKNGVVFEHDALPEAIGASAWGWRMQKKRSSQLWVLMKCDPMDEVNLEERIKALCEWSIQRHKAKNRWLSFLRKIPRLCVVVLTGTVQPKQEHWVFCFPYKMWISGLIRHVFVLDHSSGQVCGQSSVGVHDRSIVAVSGMQSVYGGLKRYMKGRFNDEGSQPPV